MVVGLRMSIGFLFRKSILLKMPIFQMDVMMGIKLDLNFMHA